MDRADLDYVAWLTTREAADIIGCGERKLLRLIESGEIEAYKDGRSYLVSLVSARSYRQKELNSKGKARANGEGSVFESPKGSGQWWAVLSINIGTETKRVKRKAKSQKSALERLDELRKLSRQPLVELPQEQETLLIDDLMIEWLEIDVKDSVKESTYLSYKESWRLHISPGLGTTEVSQVQPKTVKTWFNSLRQRTSDYTARNALACLRGALNWGVANGYILVNPALGIKLAAPKSQRPAVKLKLNEVKLLRQATEDHSVAMIIDAGLFTGNRLGELLGWQWDTIDWQEGTIEIRQQLQVLKNKKGRITNDPKTPSSKTKSVLPPRFMARLRKLYEQRLQTPPNTPDAHFVFLSANGTRRWPRSVEKQFASALEKAGLDKTYPMPEQCLSLATPDHRKNHPKSKYKRKTCAVTIHHLRHTFASLLEYLGVDENTIKALLRHGPKNVTRHYTGADFERMRAALQKLEDLILGEEEITP